MAIRNKLTLLTATVAFIFASAATSGGQGDTSHLWIKSEFRAQSTECFVADRFLFCPYEAQMPVAIFTTIGTDGLPPASERRPATMHVSSR